MSRLFIVSALAVLAHGGGLVGAQTSRSPEAQFKAAEYKQDIERDCKRAIKDFERIVRQYERSTGASERGYAARALVQSAECHRRLGDEQARPLYERVVKEFKDQAQSVALARDGLAALSRSAAIGRPVRLSTLPSGLESSGRRVLADGRLGGTDGATGNLVAIDPRTGRVARFVAGNNADPDPAKVTRAEAPVLSPDLRTVAYAWFDEGKTGGHSLRVAPIDGSTAPRTLIGSAAGAFSPSPVSWARDGSAVLALIQRNGSGNASGPFYELAWVPLTGTSIRVVQRLEAWQLQGNGADAALSPDGRFIAFAARTQQNNNNIIINRSIVVIPAAGGAGTEIAGTDNNVGPTWTADGTRLIYARQGTASSEMWSVAMRNGKASGAPEQFRSENGPVTLNGITRTGTLHYTVRRDTFSTMIIAMTDGGARIDGAAMEVTDQFSGVSPSWSPDGQFIAFKRQRDGGPYQLVVRSSRSGAEMMYAPPKVRIGGGTPRWRAARTIQPMVNERILVTVGQNGLSAREATQPLPSKGETSFDGTMTYDVTPDGTLVRTNLTTNVKTITRIPANRLAWAVSPDGRLIATISIDQNANAMALTTVAIDTGATRTRMLPIRNQQVLTWTLDSRRVLISEGSPLEWRVVLVDPAGTDAPTPTGIAFEARELSGLSLSPDGRRLAVTSRDRTTEAWMVDTPWAAR